MRVPVTCAALKNKQNRLLQHRAHAVTEAIMKPVLIGRCLNVWTSPNYFADCCVVFCIVILNSNLEYAANGQIFSCIDGHRACSG